MISRYQICQPATDIQHKDKGVPTFFLQCSTIIDFLCILASINLIVVHQAKNELFSQLAIRSCCSPPVNLVKLLLRHMQFVLLCLVVCVPIKSHQSETNIKLLKCLKPTPHSPHCAFLSVSWFSLVKPQFFIISSLKSPVLLVIPDSRCCASGGTFPPVFCPLFKCASLNVYVCKKRIVALSVQFADALDATLTMGQGVASCGMWRQCSLQVAHALDATSGYVCDYIDHSVVQ